MKLDPTGQFITLDGVAMGVYATRSKGGRWRYSDSSGHLYGSGMTPRQFVKKFWFRDYTEDA